MLCVVCATVPNEMLELLVHVCVCACVCVCVCVCVNSFLFSCYQFLISESFVRANDLGIRVGSLFAIRFTVVFTLSCLTKWPPRGIHVQFTKASPHPTHSANSFNATYLARQSNDEFPLSARALRKRLGFLLL